MTLEEQETLAQQLERAAEILRSPASDAVKITTLTRIGSIATHKGNTWADKKYQEVVDNLA